MQILSHKERTYYLEKYQIDDFFSFDVSPFLEVCQFEKGEWIFQEGLFPDTLYYMMEGKAKLYVTHKNGKVSLIEYLKAPLFMGEIELLNETKYTKGIQTVTPTICLSITTQNCKEKLLADARFLRKLCVFLGEKAANMTAKYTQNQAYPLENRLAAFIQLSAEQGIYKEKHTEICEYLGVSYRHLLYVLAQFCEQGILVKQKNGYHIVDEAGLAYLAQEIS
ncbi:transcriptional regulator YeiL [Lysinibacillus piscis]|uniref:Transcriptional regulator YeiL n=1 Tax=Lysinibacillus piscis TaxID=2518931 RepID=A0ABQ5NKX4_9BACI|nr:transcriptional regulator YeiL [Lysinibacillus sp. KH24]GLC89005.1 transcriptional regulator YeiL [Lysinibacillus sp. KH24]